MEAEGWADTCKSLNAMLRGFILWEPVKVFEQENDMISSCFNFEDHCWCKVGHGRHSDLTSSARLVFTLISGKGDDFLECFSDFPTAGRCSYHNSAV